MPIEAGNPKVGDILETRVPIDLMEYVSGGVRISYTERSKFEIIGCVDAVWYTSYLLKSWANINHLVSETELFRLFNFKPKEKKTRLTLKDLLCEEEDDTSAE